MKKALGILLIGVIAAFFINVVFEFGKRFGESKRSNKELEALTYTNDSLKIEINKIILYKLKANKTFIVIEK